MEFTKEEFNWIMELFEDLECRNCRFDHKCNHMINERPCDEIFKKLVYLSQ